MVTTHLNGHSNKKVLGSQSATPLVSGIYVPTVAFFEEGGDAVDVATVKQHAIRLAKAGVAGLVTQGSNGEAVHLDHSERMLINTATRSALDSIGQKHMPLIVGCGAQSTKETQLLCKEAYESGGNFALILPPNYYGGLLSSETILEFFGDVADTSPIPLLIYNYPGACSGLDLNSDTILLLSKHPNIVGVKLTCGNTGKLARVVAGADAPFLTMGGSADFTIQTLSVGGHGVIAGTANLAPKLCVKIFRLYEEGNYEEARKLQAVLAKGDWVCIKGGFVSVKCALQMYNGYGGAPRKPCSIPDKKELEKMKVDFEEMMELESTIA